MVIELSDRLGMLSVVARLVSEAKAEKTRLSPLAGAAAGDQVFGLLQLGSEPEPPVQVSCAGVMRSSRGSTRRTERKRPPLSRPDLFPCAWGKSRESHRR